MPRLQRLAVAHQRLDRSRSRSAPANFSLSDLRPGITGIGQHLLAEARGRRSSIFSVSSSASSSVACSVWPSCQRNSVVRRNGPRDLLPAHHVAPLVDEDRAGRARTCTHLAYIEQIMASEVGRMASGSSSSSPPPMVTQAHSGREALHVLLLLLEEALGDEEREVGVDVAGLLDAAVHVRLHVLPDARSRRAG